MTKTFFLVEPARRYSNPENHRAAGLCRPQNCRIKQKNPGGCRGSFALSMYLLAAPSCHAQDLLDPVQNVSRIQARALHLAGDLLRQHVSRIRLGRLRCDALDGAVARVFEVDPAGAAFQLAPAVLHLGDGKDALAGLAL